MNRNEERWMKNVREVTPYVPGEQPQKSKMIKLNTNENPYPPCPGVRDILDHVNAADFRLYPDPDAKALVQALARYHGVSEESVFVGVGSDDVLSMAFLTFFASDQPVLFPDITYSFYPVWAKVYQIPYRCPKLDENFQIVTEDYCQDEKIGGIVLANPNAPTSRSMPVKEIQKILEAHPEVVVIVDEAYVDFGGETALPLVDQYSNLLVVRTYSKSRSMAGIRIGYAIGNPKLMDCLRGVKESVNSYTMNQLSIPLGVASLEDEDYFQKQVRTIVETREKAKEELTNRGFQVLDSHTNFLFVKHEKKCAEEIFHELRQRDIFVRFFKKERISDYLRITVGTDEEMLTLYRALDEIL